VILREYQTRALDALRAQFQAGKRAVVLVSPTGSGKTCMGAAMALGHLTRPGRRVAWIVHRQELLDQGAAALRAIGLEVGCRGEGAAAPVQVATIQQLLARREAPEATLVIPDEAHHMAKGGLWAELLRSYLGAGARVVGPTATPARADDAALEGFDGIVVAAQIGELQRLGHLVALRIKRPGHLLRPDKIAQRPVDAYLELARGRSTVVFAPHIKAAEEYASDFRGLGIAAEVVTGKTPKPCREATLARFAAGELTVLVNVAVLTEGWDAPIASCIILARGCGSQALLIQMTGRGLRPSPGKTDCLLLDLRGVTHVMGRPDEDRVYSLEGTGIALAKPIAGPRLCRVCQLPLGDLLVCPECSAEHEMVTPKASGEKLVDYEAVAHEATKEAMKPRRDVLSLAGMVSKYGRAKGLAMFRHIFHRAGEPILGAAEAFNKSKGSARAAFAGDES
jgi:superfamily II DNA or RNA helicase